MIVLSMLYVLCAYAFVVLLLYSMNLEPPSERVNNMSKPKLHVNGKPMSAFRLFVNNLYFDCIQERFMYHEPTDMELREYFHRNRWFIRKLYRQHLSRQVQDRYYTPGQDPQS